MSVINAKFGASVEGFDINGFDEPAAPNAERDAIRHALDVLFEPGDVVELRIPKARVKGREVNWAGWFDTFDSLAAEARGHEAAGVYVTLNRVDPDMLARCANRLKAGIATTADKDIIQRRWLPIDFDPERPSGTSSTDEEHGHAHAAAQACRRWLTERGWPEPIYADSGNGAHLLFRIDLPNDADATSLVTRVLKALSQRYDSEHVHVDTSVANAARIWKLYGTTARKGDVVGGRRHRRARIIEKGSATIVSPHQLEQVALPVSGARAQQPRAAFDMGAVLATSGIAVSKVKDLTGGGHLWELAVCPFNGAHTGTASVGVQASGARFFRCLHESCSDRRWADLKPLLSIGSPLDDAVVELNETYFLVRVGADEVVAHQSGSGVVCQTTTALEKRYANKFVGDDPDEDTDEKKRAITKFEAWFRHPKRREYRTLVFAPPGFDPAEVTFDETADYNLWRGFAVEPDGQPNPEERCRLWLNHTRDVICGGGERIFNYVLNWAAAMVQTPGRPAEVAIALRGDKGTGKGLWVRWLLRIFGHTHSSQLDQIGQMAGRFNAAASAKVLIFADEIDWNANRTARGVLKRMITEPRLMIERKHIDITSEPNCMHLILATNREQSIPAELNERRWLALHVGDNFRGDHRYFGRLVEERDSGGLEALLAYLLARDISKCNLRDVPKTAELSLQQEHEMDSADSYLLDGLSRGTLLRFSPYDNELTHPGQSRWATFIVTAEWHRDYVRYCRDLRQTPIRERAFSMRLSERFRREWRTETDEGRGWRMPSLSAAREHFDLSTLAATQPRRDWPEVSPPPVVPTVATGTVPPEELEGLLK
jgi:Family of unknown function (DUF5906)